jgi:hypothetical protein
LITENVAGIASYVHAEEFTLASFVSP